VAVSIVRLTVSLFAATDDMAEPSISQAINESFRFLETIKVGIVTLHYFRVDLWRSSLETVPTE
jgi:hypothetical protein